MTKYKIAFVDHTPFIGGAQLALARHLRYLDYSRFIPFIICSFPVPGLMEKFRQTGVKIVPIPFGRLKVFPLIAIGRLLVTAWRLGRAVCQEKADLIVANSERSFYPSLLVSFLMRKKIISWVRDFEYPRFSLNFFGRGVAKFIFVSQAVRDYCGFTSSPKAQVVYVGTDLLEMTEKVGAGEVAAQRQKWELGKGVLAIGFAGRLVAWKGVSVLLQAVKILKECGLDGRFFKMLIAGEDRGQEGGNAEELKAYVCQHGLEDVVSFVGFLQNIALFYKSLDIFVHPSIKPEPFATVIVEAMAFGLPVTAAAAGGTPEIIIDRDNGLLFPTGSAVVLAEKLKELILDKNLRLRLGEKAQQTVGERFNEEKVTREAEKAYLEVLEKS